jgi:hypothetical protein
MSRFLIEEYETVDVAVLRANRDQVYAIELTLDGQVCTGTACILAEPNVCGIPVRKAIVADTHVPFSDQEAEREALLQALRKLYRLASGRKLRLPLAGLGAGPYGLAAHSPRIHRDVCQILADHFGYQQPLVKKAPRMVDNGPGETYHHEVFFELCTRGGFYMTQSVADKHGLTVDELKALCLRAGRELDAQGRIFPMHLPTYRWASGE